MLRFGSASHIGNSESLHN